MDSSEGSINDVVNIYTSILEELDRKKIDPNIAQAALGSAWVTLVHVLGWSKQHFIDSCIEAAEIEWQEE